MARLCRGIDWSVTTLGAPDGWPASLRTAVRMALDSPFPINLWCGPDLQLIYNDGYRAVLGAKHPAALARPGHEVWAEIWTEIAPRFETIRAGGAPAYAEDAPFVIERANGPPGEGWLTFSLSAIRGEDGEIVGFLNVVSETTARVVAVREAAAARATAEDAGRVMRDVFAQAPAFLAVVRGADHVFEFANDAYVRLVGDRDILGKPAAEALPEVRAQGFIDLLDKVLETGEPYVGREIPISLTRRTGAAAEQLFVDFVYQPLTDGTGRRVGVVAHGVDVTDAVDSRREMERLWKESERARTDAMESEARYRFLSNAIPVQVWTATPDGALDFVSDRTADYFGKTVEEVIGDQWLTVLHPEDFPRIIERWTRSLATGEPYEVEFRLWSHAHQSFRWHLGRATAQRDESGNVVRWFGTNTEIEDWKRAEVELERLTVEATEANRAKGDFLAAMSHELRTPLNAIGGYAQLIEMGGRGPVTEAQRIDLLKIQRSKNHLDSLVGEVLSFAKLGSGRIEFRVRDVGVEKLLDEVVEMVTPQLEQKQLRLLPITMLHGLAISADEDKTRQILLNLFANALKFTPQGGTISVAVSERAGVVAIAVADTGMGIAEDQFERIFEPFIQAERALNPSDQGVGLGLAISRQLSRAMRGDLHVASAVGQGLDVHADAAEE